MPLLSFSDTNHVPLIFDGKKAQTTRTPRKNPVKSGDTLYVYLRSRMKKSCKNCLNHSSITGEMCPIIISDSSRCPKHTNYFGTAAVIKVEDFDPHSLSLNALEEWAQADGFQNYTEANEWFTKVHGKDWIYQPWVIIYFKGDWVK